MNEDMYRRRRLRLGALLFQLRYYMQTPDDVAASIYRYNPDTYARVVGERVRLVAGDHEETMDLEDAIARCKAALSGVLLHGGSGAESDAIAPDVGGDVGGDVGNSNNGWETRD